MTNEMIKLLPLPDVIPFSAEGARKAIQDYARANIAALAQRVAELEFESRQGWALAKGYQREMEKAEARAERLAEALRKAEEYIDDVTPTWASGGQGVLAIIRAALNPAAAQEKNDA